MKKKSIVRLVIYAGFLAILAFILIPESGSTHHPDWQLVAKAKLRSLNVLYATYTSSGARIRPLNSIEELKDFAMNAGGDLSLFSTYDPLNKRETEVVYFKPKSIEEDELIFVFEDPIIRTEKPSYTDEDINGLRYIACYTKSGIVSMESQPLELRQTKPAEDGSG